MYKLFCDYCENEVRNSDEETPGHEYKLIIKEGHNKNLLDMDLCKKCTRKFMRLLVEVSGGDIDSVEVEGKKVR